MVSRIPYTMHGLSRDPLYKQWSGMIQRCYNKKHEKYRIYGARGIRVCDEWRYNFKNFYDYMPKRPSKNYTLDRIDNDGNYEPGNVRWATRTQQQYNRNLIPNKSNVFTGVFLHKNKLTPDNYMVHIRINKETHYLGVFETIEEAISMRLTATYCI